MKHKLKIVTPIIFSVITLCIIALILTKAEASEISKIKYKTDTIDKIVDNRLVTIGSHKDKIEVTLFRDGTAKIRNKNNSVYEYKISDEAIAMVEDILSRDEFKEICGDMKEHNYYISYKESNTIYFCTTDSLHSEKKFSRVYTIVMKLIEQKHVVLA